MKKKSVSTLALASFALVSTVHALGTNDIQIWTGSGTNRAALVIEWSTPEVFNNSTVPAPVTDKTLVWGYRFNGTSTATEMFNAVVAADRRLYAVVVVDPTYGQFVEGIGYNLNGNGNYALSDGTKTDSSSAFVAGILDNSAGALNIDAAFALHGGDLYWGGYDGPNWVTWNELGDAGGFAASPNRGTSQYYDSNTYNHGQWSEAEYGLDDLILYDGSWIGFSVAAAGYSTNNPAALAYNLDEHAPPSPEGNYAAYVDNTNDFAAQVVSTNDVSATVPYNEPAALLGPPALMFEDSLGDGTGHRVKIIEPPYATDLEGNPVITKINATGTVTLKMGRKVYDDSNNPYGVDLIVYGNSFFSASGTSGFISDATDLDTARLSTGYSGHGLSLSVSQDGINWYTYPDTGTLFPENAYRWDDTNASWTDEPLNPTKPLNPSLVFGSQTVAAALDQFIGASGGTGYDLKASGFPWIQYVRLTPLSGTYTVIDAVAAVNPAVEGDDLSITPGNLVVGVTNLVFQAPGNTSQTLIALDFHYVNGLAKVSTAALSEFSSYAPVPGAVLGGYLVAVAAVPETNAVAYQADLGLSIGTNYTGNGADLCVLQWTGTNWAAPTFSFNAAGEQVQVSGLTNLGALVVTQLPQPPLRIETNRLGPVFTFTPALYLTYVLERSTDLINWSPLSTNTPAVIQPLTMQDNAPPAQRAFYRLRLHP